MEGENLKTATGRSIHHLIGTLLGEYIYAFYEKFKGVEYLPWHIIEDYHGKRLRRIIPHFYKTDAFFRKRLDGAGIDPFDVNHPSKLKKIPLITREDIKSQYENKRFPPFKLWENIYTGGSTGVPLHLVADHRSMGQRRAAALGAYNWWGLEAGCPRVLVWAVASGSWKGWKQRVYDFLLNRVRIPVFKMGIKHAQKQYERMRRFSPNYLYAYPSSLEEFARALVKLDIDGRELGLKLIITSTEVLLESQRKLIEEVFGCAVANEYGLSEVGVVGFECQRGRMHILPHYIIVEFLPVEDMLPPDNGFAYYHVIVTDTSNRMTPVIRYDSGDLAVLDEADSCPCGRSGPIIRRIVGKFMDNGILPDGSQFSHEIITTTAVHDSLMRKMVYQFQTIQHTPSDFEVILKVHERYDKTEYRRKAEKRVKEIFTYHLGGGLNINVQFSKDIIKDPSEKRRYFIRRF